jgi:N-acetylglutamate synthase-like GNAT family acetyltransferase
MGILIFENSFVGSENFRFSILALAPTVLICRHTVVRGLIESS